MKVYADYSHYHKENRKYLIGLLTPLWNDLSNEQRINVYGEWITKYSFTDNPEEADLHLLPMRWDYYIDNGVIDLAETAINQAHKFNKRIVIFNFSDYTAKIPFQNVTLFEPSGYRSKKRNYLCYGMPPMTDDNLQIHYGGNPIYRHKNKPPVIGFCGATSRSRINHVFASMANSYRKVISNLGILKWEPPPFETRYFRKQVLDAFVNDKRVFPNFILRKNWGGKSTTNFKLDFIRNIYGSDYTICMRGIGNYSYRFYETLSLGRIPVFINTDCLLPWDKIINYRELFPWIELNEIPYAVEILLDFHYSHSDDEFIELQKHCRELWLRHFTYRSFNSDFINYFSQNKF